MVPVPETKTPESHQNPPLAVIGGGNMASAILAGARAADAIHPDRFVVADPNEASRSAFRHSVGSATEALAWLAAQPDGEAGQVLLAVKPQVFPKVADEIRGLLASSSPTGDRSASGPRVVVSIIAGTTSGTIRAALGGGVRVVRVMPNTPAQVGRGMSAVALGEGSSPNDAAFAERLMRAVGQTVTIDESMMDAFTGLAGSGPAYVFYLAEALAHAGEAVGFTAEQASIIAEHVVTGSARLLEEDDRGAAALRKAVTSPNGTTQAGTESLDASGMMDAVVKAVTAARDRGRELAAG